MNKWNLQIPLRIALYASPIVEQMRYYMNHISAITNLCGVTFMIAAVEQAYTNKTPQISFNLNTQCSPSRLQIQDHIKSVYKKTYDADVVKFQPLLLAMQKHNHLQAVVGIRPGNNGDFFLEQYIEKPIEQKAAEIICQPITRSSIVEIGNLAALQRGTSQLLFIILNASLQQAKYQWLMFTATPEVKKLIGRLNCHPHSITEAAPEKLIDKKSNWGRYYNTHPEVMLLSINEAMIAAQNLPRVQQVIEAYSCEIKQLAKQLVQHKRSEQMAP